MIEEIKEFAAIEEEIPYKSMQWQERPSPIIKTFQLEQEPVLIHLVRMGSTDTWALLLEDIRSQVAGEDPELSILSTDQIKELFKIELQWH